MGLMDKFKNLFTDEEIIEEDDVDTIEIKEVKKEEEVNKLPTFMREKIEKEEKKGVEERKNVVKPDLELKPKEIKEEKREVKLEKVKTTGDEMDLPKIEERNSFKFPIAFSENDFVETRSRQSIHQRKNEVNERIESEVPPVVKREKKVNHEPKVADLYKDKREKTEEKSHKFKATPIISPIYGVLDKNYTPSDMEVTTGENFEDRRHSKNVDFDSVRKKAYGNLSQEIKENLMCENCEYLKEVKECHKEKRREQTNELSYDVLEEEEETPAYYRDITLDEATENYYDYGVEYEKQPEPYQEEHPEPKEEIKISNFEEERPKKEIPPVKSSINLLSTLKKSMGDPVEVKPEPKKEEKNLELTDDLFNLIDSMYDERNEEKW